MNTATSPCLLSTVAVIAVLSCTRSGGPPPEPDANAADIAASSFSPPSVPTVFSPGIISNEHEQWRITFTPDGRTAYFAESPEFFPATRQAHIYVSHLANGEWSTPEIAPFSGVHSDMDPFITPDGRRLYFSSIRPAGGVGRDDLDLFVMEMQPSGRWGEPARLGPEVNSEADELYASASADGTLYFAAGPIRPQAGAHWDIYRAVPRGDGFAPRESLGEAVNSSPSPDDPSPVAAWDFNPEISPDGRTLVFTSLRPGGHGLGDLYVSRRTAEGWTPAENLGAPVNTDADEFHPTLSRDGQALYFVRRGPGRGDFYVVATGAVPALSANTRNQPPAGPR